MTAETHADARERLRPYVERAAAVSGWVMDPDPRGLSPRSWDYVARASELIARVLSELRAFQARRQADSEAGRGLGDQLRHQG